MTPLNLKTTGKMSGASTNNPLGKIINLIPWTLTVVTTELLDSIALVLATASPKPTQNINQYILSCLYYLQQLGYVDISALKMDTAEGKFYIIKRI